MHLPIGILSLIKPPNRDCRVIDKVKFFLTMVGSSYTADDVGGIWEMSGKDSVH